MTATDFKWTVNYLGGHELRVDGVAGSSKGFKGSLAYVCQVMSLTPGKPTGCSISYPGWTGESQTYHRNWKEARAAAEAAVRPYVEETLAARRAALIEAAARAIHRWDRKPITWDNLYSDDQVQYRSEAECVLDAILPLLNGGAA